MVPQWIIEKKRDGCELTADEIRGFVDAYSAGDLPDYQMSAFAMAVLFRGMTFAEVTEMTDAMMRSGDVLDFSGLARPSVDKHSTGGIGDKISIPLAPVVAAAGAAVPMISGRGLGITGGTLDKLESIPGYNTQLSTERFRKILETVGCSIIGQTSRLAPADKKLYALRDVTGTVPSIPLISSSIMSKKLAEGASGLVLDVKCGSGAFMKTVDEARELAETMLAIGRNTGRGMAAVITDMNQPLGRAVGNALEIRESIDILAGRGPADTSELTVLLASEMLVLAGISPDVSAARKAAEEMLESGRAMETFAKMVEAHGGDPHIIDNPGIMGVAPVIVDVPSPADGYVRNVDAEKTGNAVLLLGGGRKKVSDAIDHAVGIDRLVASGERVSAGDPLMRIHAGTKESADSVMKMLSEAVAFSESPLKKTGLLIETVK